MVCTLFALLMPATFVPLLLCRDGPDRTPNSDNCDWGQLPWLQDRVAGRLPAAEADASRVATPHSSARDRECLQVPSSELSLLLVHPSHLATLWPFQKGLAALRFFL